MADNLKNEKHAGAESVKCSDLLCCPFCGKQPEAGITNIMPFNDFTNYIQCQNCGYYFIDNDFEALRKMWNTRAT